MFLFCVDHSCTAKAFIDFQSIHSMLHVCIPGAPLTNYKDGRGGGGGLAEVHILSGVSTSFEVGGWKTKVGGCDEVRGQRPRDTRGVRGQAPPGKF